MFYDRKIKYLDYLENGDKIRSAGFVKIEAAEDVCNIQINISGLYPTDTFAREVWIGNGNRETVLGEVEMQSGRGQVRWKKLSCIGLGKERIPYRELSEFRIKLARNRELCCKWAEDAGRSKPEGISNNKELHTGAGKPERLRLPEEEQLEIIPIPEQEKQVWDSQLSKGVSGTTGVVWEWVPELEEEKARNSPIARNESALWDRQQVKGEYGNRAETAGAVPEWTPEPEEERSLSRPVAVNWKEGWDCEAANIATGYGSDTDRGKQEWDVGTVAGKSKEVVRESDRQDRLTESGKGEKRGSSNVGSENIVTPNPGKAANRRQTAGYGSQEQYIEPEKGVVRYGSDTADRTEKWIIESEEGKPRRPITEYLYQEWCAGAGKGEPETERSKKQEITKQEVIVEEIAPQIQAGSGSNPADEVIPMSQNQRESASEQDGLLYVRWMATEKEMTEGNREPPATEMAAAVSKPEMRWTTNRIAPVDWRESPHKEKSEERIRKGKGEWREEAELKRGGDTPKLEQNLLVTPGKPEIPVEQKNPYLPEKLYDDKWKQLSYLYPHISPFHDERDYLSIGPGDFVIMQGKYHKLVNNSFLLHGYYNYEHLILARMTKRGEECFYVGVPGNFYDREKQVALMFGFESFECKKEPAQTGDYGYYMIRVEL